MIGVEETESGLRVWDSAKNEVYIQTKGSNFIGEPCLIDRADESFRSILRKLIFQADGYSVFDSENDQWTTYGSRIGEKSQHLGITPFKFILVLSRMFGSADLLKFR